jgi:hypothetical protein
MPEVMSHAQWMKLTDGGMLSVRSSELKRIDAALAEYHKAQTSPNLDALQKAIVGWMQVKGPGWKTSVRNRLHAVDDLHKQAMGLPLNKTAGDIIGLSELRDSSRKIVSDLFHGKTLEWRPGFFKKLAATKCEAVLNTRSFVNNVDDLSRGAVVGAVTSAGRGAASGLRSIGLPDVPLPNLGLPRLGVPGRSGAVESFCKMLISDPQLYVDVMGLIAFELPTFMVELAAALTPFVGVITSGSSALVGACKAIRAQYRIYEANEFLQRQLCVGEPMHALRGLIRILDRELVGVEARAAISLAECVGKLAGVLADGGIATTAAVGLTANLANLTLLILDIARDVKERKEANKLMLLARGVDASVFEASPVIGAYLICCAPTSVMVNTVFDRYFERGWRGDVEATVKEHINPLKEQARRVVAEHRFWIPSLQNFPGVLEVNKKKLKEMQEKKGKTGMIGFGWEDPETRPRR